MILILGLLCTLCACGAARPAETPAQASAPETVRKYWTILLLLLIAFAILAVIALEFIDRDKR